MVPTIAKLDKTPLQPARKDKETFSYGYLRFVLLYFDFWTISVHGSFEDSSHFVPVIDTHYDWAACGLLDDEIPSGVGRKFLLQNGA